MEASGWLFESRTSEVEHQEAQRRDRGAMNRLRRTSLQRPSKGLPCSPPLCLPVVGDG